MRHGLPLLMMLNFGACASTPTEPPVERLAPSHVLTVTLAAACGGPPSSSFSPFDLTVFGRLEATGSSKFVAVPPNDARCNQSTLDLQVDVTGPTAEGTIAGQECFVITGGVFTASFSRPGVAPGRLRGEVRQNERGDLEVVNGVLDGTINVGLKFSSAGVECIAVDHTWSLRPVR